MPMQMEREVARAITSKRGGAQGAIFSHHADHIVRDFWEPTNVYTEGATILNQLFNAAHPYLLLPLGRTKVRWEAAEIAIPMGFQNFAVGEETKLSGSAAFSKGGTTAFLS